MSDKALLYKCGGANGVFDMIHLNIQEFNEIYIPELGLCINNFNNSLSVFKTDKPRNRIISYKPSDGDFKEDIKEIILSKTVINKIVKIAEVNELKEKVSEELKDILD